MKNYTITNIEISSIDDNEFDYPCIQCIVTNLDTKQKIGMVEWLNDDKLEQRDSHLEINGKEALMSGGFEASQCDEIIEEVRELFIKKLLNEFGAKNV